MHFHPFLPGSCYITKSVKNGHFLARYRKKLLRRPHLILDFTYISLSVSEKTDAFYLIKWLRRPFSPYVSTYGYFINFKWVQRLFYNNNSQFYLTTSSFGVPSHYISAGTPTYRQLFFSLEHPNIHNMMLGGCCCGFYDWYTIRRTSSVRK